jgi:regulatory protein
VAERASTGRARARRETPAAARERRGAIDDPEVVLAAAARLLESRQRTVHEIRNRLTVAGYRPDLVDWAVTRLLALGYLDDVEFARAWVASRDRTHPRGERALRFELARKGVPRDVTDVVLAERGAAATDVEETTTDDAAPGADGGGAADMQAAERLLERRRSSLDRIPDPRDRRRRAYALLARAGFDPGTAAEVAAGFVRGDASE